MAMDGFAAGPGFTLPDDLGRKPLVLNVWASWCKPCRTEMPVFQAVSLQLPDRVGFLGVDYLDQQNAARRLVAETGVTYPLAADPRGRAGAKLGVTGLPTTVFIGADGVVRGRRVGELNASRLRDAIRSYLEVAAP
jgi:cytochrome c biogenesis protein CcmG, thiol:disulfide interchange protein DsbE